MKVGQKVHSEQTDPRQSSLYKAASFSHLFRNIFKQRKIVGNVSRRGSGDARQKTFFSTGTGRSSKGPNQ